MTQMTTEAQNGRPAGSLFPHLCQSVPSVDPHPRGWNAIPVREFVLTLAATNASGSRTLTFRYRPLARWDAARLEAAERLIGLYFEHFGGFRLADQAIVAAWYQALQLYTEDEVRDALRAKWRSIQGETSERRRELRQFVAKPETAPRTLGYWLAQSPEEQRRQEAQREKAAKRQLDGLKALSSQPSAPSQHGPDADRLKTESCELTASRRAARLAAQQQARADFWANLSQAQQWAAVSAVRPQFLERCKQWAENPEDPRMDGVLRDMALHWASYRWPPHEDHHHGGTESTEKLGAPPFQGRGMES